MPEPRSVGSVLSATSAGATVRLRRTIKSWRGVLPALAIVVATVAMCWTLLKSPFQFVINDFGAFGPRMLSTCPLAYEQSGLGREPHTSPSYCFFGALSAAFGGTTAQHLLFVGCFAVAGLSMYALLRRIGNPPLLAFVGAVCYELSPIMLSFQVSGEGLLITAALLPAVLVGTVTKRGKGAPVEGIRSGVLMAAICYANPQGPALAAFLLIPGVAYLAAKRGSRGRAYATTFCGCFVGAFVLAALPVFEILPGFGSAVQAMKTTLASDLAARLAWDPVSDFARPYLIVGIVPAALGVLSLPAFGGARPAEKAAAVALGSILALWECLQLVGVALAHLIPFVTLYKDFIKLQIVIAIPLVILSCTALRWAISTRERAFARTGHGLVIALAILMVAPVMFGQQLPVMYETGLVTPLNGQSLLGGELGLPSWSRVPLTYDQVLGRIHSQDPRVSDYRVLWIPIDWRLVQTARAADVNLLLSWSDGSTDSQRAISQAFDAIANSETAKIAPLLGELGVKYVVLDLADGQDRNSEVWQKGPPINLAIWGTQALTGRPSDYAGTLARSPGLEAVGVEKPWIVYRNREWRPILSTYAGLLAVGPESGTGAAPPRGAEFHLTWVGARFVRWKQLSDASVRVEPFVPDATEATPWAPVSTRVPVSAGGSYEFRGSMDFVTIVQSHVKIVWQGNLTTDQATTYLEVGHNGTGTASWDTRVIAPPGSKSAQLFLMGGWSTNGEGYTRFRDLSIRPVTAPELNALKGHPDRLVSLWHELPALLISPEAKASLPPEIAAKTVELTTTASTGSQTLEGVRLLTPADLTISGDWAVDAIPDALGIEQFQNIGPGEIAVRQDIVSSSSSGSTAVWLEYTSAAVSPRDGVIRSARLQPGTGVVIRCSSPNCRISNVLIVPPIRPAGALARFGYAYSPMLLSPESGGPIAIPGDWASFYVPPPHGYPSSTAYSSSVSRLVGLIVGYAAIAAGLVIGVLPARLARLSLLTRRRRS